MIVEEFRDAALELTWKQALICMGLRWGVTDEAGRPVNAWARHLIPQAKRAFRARRRDFLQGEKFWKDHLATLAISAGGKK